jgi:hypothetical protein
MPQCTVYVYDDTLSAVSSKFIEIRDCDSFGKKIDIQPAAMLGPGEFGAKITLPNPPEPIVVWVNDTSSHFAPTTLAHFNGKETARLDVTLYPLPTGPGGGGGGVGPRGGAVWQTGVQTVDAIARHIHLQVESKNWTDSEALGVKSLVDTTTRAINAPNLDQELQDALSRWRQQLKDLGITIMAEAQNVVVSTTRTMEA